MVVSKLKKHAVNIGLETSGLTLPKSLLIIPDGNGRWAKQMGLSVSEGHKAGGKTISKILDGFMQTSIEVLGIWGFSEDNWKRETSEIDKIMEVVDEIVKQNLNKLLEKGVRFLVLGKKDRLQSQYPKLFATLENVVNLTNKNTNKTLALFLDYGERFQLEEFAKARLSNSSTETYELLSNINAGLPLFDMVLRTSGELRLSGFGPLADLAEFVSVKKNLPELTDVDMLNALKEFSTRERRFGGR